MFKLIPGKPKRAAGRRTPPNTSSGVFRYNNTLNSHITRPMPPSGVDIKLDQKRSVGRVAVATKSIRRPMANRIFKVSVLIFILGLVWSVTRLDTSNSNIIYPSTYSYLRTELEYKSTVEEVLKHKLIRSNKLTIDKNTVESEISKKLPEITSAQFSFSILGRRPIAKLIMREASAIVVSSDGSYALDAKGFVFFKLGSNSASTPASVSKLPVLVDTSGADIKLGTTFLPSSDIKFAAELQKQAVLASIVIDKMVLPASARQISTHFAGDSFDVKFYSGGDPAVQFGAYRATQKNLSEQGRLPKEYIDVRAEDRVFYK